MQKTNNNDKENINDTIINEKKNIINETNIISTKERIDMKITIFKTIQSISKFVNRLINNSSSSTDIEEENKIISDNMIKRNIFDSLIPYIQQYKKEYGNKKMPILYLLQCVIIVFEENHRKEKEQLLKEINNLKRSMNQMHIHIQLMGGGRDILKSTLYYLILIFIPEEQNIPSFFTKIQKLIKYFQNKVNNDLNLLKNLNPSINSNIYENTNQIIKRLHQNSQYVLFIKTLFFMHKYLNYLVHLNKNENLKKQNNESENALNKNIENNDIEDTIIKDDEINEDNDKNINNSLITKINSKNMKYNLPLINNYFIKDNTISFKKDMIFPTFNFNDCFTSFANFLDEMVKNEKTQIIIEQVINKIEEENNEGELPKFEINDLFQKKDGKRIFNLTGLDVQVIIHEIRNLKYQKETLEDLVNSKTWEKGQKDQ